jgi:hypothetical protein
MTWRPKLAGLALFSTTQESRNPGEIEGKKGVFIAYIGNSTLIEAFFCVGGERIAASIVRVV